MTETLLRRLEKLEMIYRRKMEAAGIAGDRNKRDRLESAVWAVRACIAIAQTEKIDES